MRWSIKARNKARFYEFFMPLKLACFCWRKVRMQIAGSDVLAKFEMLVKCAYFLAVQNGA